MLRKLHSLQKLFLVFIFFEFDKEIRCYFKSLKPSLPGSHHPWCGLLRSYTVCPRRERCQSCCPCTESPSCCLGSWFLLPRSEWHTTDPAANTKHANNQCTAFAINTISYFPWLYLFLFARQTGNKNLLRIHSAYLLLFFFCFVICDSQLITIYHAVSFNAVVWNQTAMTELTLVL